ERLRRLQRRRPRSVTRLIRLTPANSQQHPTKNSDVSHKQLELYGNSKWMARSTMMDVLKAGRAPGICPLTPSKMWGAIILP
ncbi:hypothetical protein, partial [Rhizobium sp. BE258]|uniref:hypothetical protein n=1 Tax=Rhizobium sp. BE258 TaxID=2817722 RepID=UPI00286AF561